MNIVEKGLRMLREEGVKAFVKKSSSYVFRKAIDVSGLGYVLAYLIVRKLRSSVCNVSGIHEAVDFTFSFNALGVSIKPIQVMYEIAKLLELVARLKPKTVLEIGTAGGGTLFLFTRVADPEATIISIDLPGGPFGGGYPRWKIPLYKSFSREGQKIYLIRRSSHDPKTLEEVKRILSGERVDFLFIDGDHTYEGVKKDFEMYSPLVKKGGIIAFHDLVPGPFENVGGVPKFWNEIKRNFAYMEIVKDWKQNGCGIGVIYV